MRHAASLQRLLVPLVQRVLPLGSIELGDTGGVGFLYLAPDDLCLLYTSDAADEL